jgi:solute carrier family 25 phosphate transporter 23/24/25/41
VVPYVGLNFGVYETLKAMMLKHYDLRDERDLSVAARLAAGAAAGTTGQTVAYPFDVARRRLQVCLGGGGGLRRGWQGMAAYMPASRSPICRIASQHLSIQFRLHPHMHQALQAVTHVVWWCTWLWPRGLLQVSGWQGARELHSDHGSVVVYRGMMDCFVRTVREEGFQALFKGLWPNYLKVVPSIAIAFVTYEQVKELLGVEFRISD